MKIWSVHSSWIKKRGKCITCFSAGVLGLGLFPFWAGGFCLDCFALACSDKQYKWQHQHTLNAHNGAARKQACLNRWLFNVLFLLLVIIIVLLIIILLVISAKQICYNRWTECKPCNKVTLRDNTHSSSSSSSLTSNLIFFCERHVKTHDLQSPVRLNQLEGCKTNLWLWSKWSSRSFLRSFNIFLFFLFLLLFVIILVEGLIGLHHLNKLGNVSNWVQASRLATGVVGLLSHCHKYLLTRCCPLMWTGPEPAFRRKTAGGVIVNPPRQTCDTHTMSAWAWTAICHGNQEFGIRSESRSN